MVDGRNRPFLRSYETSTFCNGLYGKITVVNPNAGGRVYNLDVNNDVNITIAVTGLASMLAQAASISADVASTIEGNAPAVVRVTRSSANTSFPLGVELSWTGTASNRLDYDLLPGFALVRANATSTTINLDARADGLAEGVESVTSTITVRSADYAFGGTGSTILTISDVPPVITSIVYSGYDVQISFRGLPNVRYYLQTNSDLAPGNWQTLATNLTGGDGLCTFSDSLDSNARKFYRGSVLP